jgi:hypothetical protein
VPTGEECRQLVFKLAAVALDWGKTPRAVECRQKRRERLTGEVRGRPQEPPTTRGNWCDQTRKRPNRERLGLCLLVGWRHSHSARKAAWMLDFRRFDFSSCPQSCPLRSIIVATFSLRARTFMAEGLRPVSERHVSQPLPSRQFSNRIRRRGRGPGGAGKPRHPCRACLRHRSGGYVHRRGLLGEE